MAIALRKLLVFQHVATEPLGVLDPMLRRSGLRVRYVNFGRTPHACPPVVRYDGLVVLGGPMNVGEIDAHPHLAIEIDAIRRAVERGVPVLGICLGAQLLAAALGAAVYPAPQGEIGWHRLQPAAGAPEDPLCRHLAGAPQVFQWHGHTFNLPRGAVHLASTSTCRNQAFRYGSRAYGLQFHLEANAALIERWLRAYAAQVQAHGGRELIERIRHETQHYIGAALQLAESVFREFIGLFALKPSVRFGSR